MSGLGLRMKMLSLELPNRLGRAVTRLATIGTVHGDSLHIFPDLNSVSTPPIRQSVNLQTTTARFAQTAHVFALTPMLRVDAHLSASGGIRVFDLTHEISTLYPSGSSNFVVLFSAALFLAAILHRSDVLPAPVTEMGSLFMSAVRRLTGNSKSAPTPTPEPPQNEGYVLPESVNLRPISRNKLLQYATDATGKRQREGFYLIRASEGLPPLLIPIDLVRMAVEQGNIAQIPSIPFRDPVTRQTFSISPSWSIKRSSGTEQPFDPHAQIVGVIVKNNVDEIVVVLPWVEGWMTHSPMTYDPLRDAPHRWIAPNGWNGQQMTMIQRSSAAAELMAHLSQMDYLTPEQEEALAIVASAITNPKMDSGVARWAVNAVMHGRNTTVYLANQVAGLVRDFPIEWIFDRPLDVGLDAEVVLTPDFIQTIMGCMTATHDVFPALYSSSTLFPRRPRSTRLIQ